MRQVEDLTRADQRNDETSLSTRVGQARKVSCGDRKAEST